MRLKQHTSKVLLEIIPLFYFGEPHILISWVPKSPQMVTAAMKLKDAYSLEEKL